MHAWLTDDPYPQADVEDWPDDDDHISEGALDGVLAHLRRVLALQTELGDAVAAGRHRGVRRSRARHATTPARWRRSARTTSTGSSPHPARVPASASWPTLLTDAEERLRFRIATVIAAAPRRRAC